MNHWIILYDSTWSIMWNHPLFLPTVLNVFPSVSFSGSMLTFADCMQNKCLHWPSPRSCPRQTQSIVIFLSYNLSSLSSLSVRIESWRKFFVHGCYCGCSLLVWRWIMDEATVMFKCTAIIGVRFQKAAVWVYFCLLFFIVDLVLRWLSLLCFIKWRIKGKRNAHNSPSRFI